MKSKTIRRWLGDNYSLTTANEHESVTAAAQRMTADGVGSVLVSDGGRITGILTERDIVRRVVCRGHDPSAMRVGSVMSNDLMTASLDDTIDACRQTMERAEIRHLPIRDEQGTIVAMFSASDLARQRRKRLTREVEDLRHYVHQYR